MFWKKQQKKLQDKDGEEITEIRRYSKEGGHIKSLERQGGITTSASYGGMGVRELQLRMELLVEPELSASRSVFKPAKELAVFAKVDQDRFLNSVEKICNTSVELAFEFCQYAPKSLQIVDEENWEDWLSKLIEIYGDKGVDACINTMQNVEDYVQSISLAPSSVTLNEISRILESFITGLSGRYLGIEVNNEFYSDTESIRLPEVASQFKNREDNFTLYKAMAVHQWAQSWYGTWRMNVEALVKTFKDQERALSLFHKLETIRLDARIANELPGIARSMHSLNERYNTQDNVTKLSKGWLRAIEKLKEPTSTVRDTMFFLELIYKDKNAPADKLYQGCLKPHEARITIESRTQKEKQALADKLVDLQKELEKSKRQNTENEYGKVSDESVAESGEKRFSFKKIKDDYMPDGFKIELQYDEKKIEPPEDIQQLLASILQDFGEVPDDYLIDVNETQYDNETNSDESIQNDAIEFSEDVFLYDEWDHSRQKYRKQWCHLKEIEVQAVHDNFVNKTLHKHRGLIKHLHRTFEALREDNKRIKRQPFGEDIDLDAVVESYVDTKIGMEASQNLFTKSHKIDRNIAVMFMIDMSGSTTGWINEMEREALVLLCESLEILGDRYAIYGFSGVTHQRCELFKVKQFDEAYNDEVKGRISGIEPQDYTRMGVAIRHLSKLLNQVEARTKLLITISDGRPDDQDGYRGPYGIEDTRRALIEAKFIGIHPFCITIDKEAMDYLQHMYGAVNFVVIDHVDKLPYKVSDIYRHLTI
jgi:nitric oxide reductase NorD protein